jgi:WD40 repeat protein
VTPGHALLACLALTSSAALKDGDSGLLGSSGFAVQSPAQRQDVATGQQIGSPLIGNPLSVAINTVNSVAFSPDGKILATGSVDGTVRLWNVAAATGRQIRSLRTADPYGPTWVAFSPHGKTLATGSTDGTARLWNVGYLADVLGQLCSRIGGSLTRAEWAKYVPAGPAYQNVCR